MALFGGRRQEKHEDTTMPAWARRWLVFGEVPTTEPALDAFKEARYMWRFRGGRDVLPLWWAEHRAELMAEAEAAGVDAFGRMFDAGTRVVS